VTVARVSRWIRGFDASGELAAEHRLPAGWSIERLRELWGVPDDDPMFDAYPLGALQAHVLGDELGQALVSCGLAFFLEADADDRV